MQGLTTSMGAMVDHDLNRVTPEVIACACVGGDAIAREIYAQAGFYIGIVAANVCVSGAAEHRDRGRRGAGRRRAAGADPAHAARAVTMMPIEQVEVLPASLGSNAGVSVPPVGKRSRLKVTEVFGPVCGLSRR